MILCMGFLMGWFGFVHSKFKQTRDDWLMSNQLWSTVCEAGTTLKPIVWFQLGSVSYMKLSDHSPTVFYTALQSQMAATAYSKSKQLLPFGFALGPPDLDAAWARWQGQDLPHLQQSSRRAEKRARERLPGLVTPRQQRATIPRPQWGSATAMSLHLPPAGRHTPADFGADGRI